MKSLNNKLEADMPPEIRISINFPKARPAVEFTGE